MSICTSCREDKPKAEFYSGGRSDGTSTKCRPCTREYAAAYRAANREKIRAYARKWTEENHASEIERGRRYRDANREAFNRRERERMQRKRNADPAAALAYTRAYRKANPERARQWHAKKRAVRAGAIARDVVTAAEWRAIKQRYRGRCAYCLKRCDNPQMDHIKPLSKGGRHLASNIAPACGPCNGSKHNRDAQQWLMQKHGRFA